MTYESAFSIESATVPGVVLTVRRVSVARRLDLLRQIREATARAEFYSAGADLADKLDASIASSEIERVYVTWGIAAITGLLIDGVEATPETLVTRGPESLAREAATLVRSQLGLTEEERKN